MKKVNIVWVFVMLIVTSCQTEEIIQENSEEQTTTPAFSGKFGGSGYPTNEMVVQYDGGLDEVDKDILRAQYGVSSYKRCECADPSLEMWIFTVDSNGNLPGGIDLEEVVVTAKDDSGLEGADFNPDFQHGGIKLGTSFGTPDVRAGMELMVPQNDNVTIAVLDTGVDYNYFGFTEPFLYNTSLGSDGCNENGYVDFYGWDFVNQDNDPFDDYGHGTIISNIIYEELTENDVPFQILPVKVFNNQGDASYFDILCGFKYAVNNSDVDIINMSFGWYYSESSLLGRFVEESLDRVMITASAGNSEQDNDVTPHMPSSFPSNNLLSVAALRDHPTQVGLASFSNYGVNSVDVAARGENIPFYIDQNDFIVVGGTSYASAYAAAFSGEWFEEGMIPQHLLETVVSNTIQHPNLNTIRFSSYIHY